MNDIERIASKILEDIKNDTNPTEINALNRLQSNSEKSLKYSGILYKVNQQKIKYKKLEAQKYAELYKYFRYDSSYLITKKADIESHIFRDEDYYKIKMKLEGIENLSSLLTNVVRIYMDREASQRVIAKAYVEGVK